MRTKTKAPIGKLTTRADFMYHRLDWSPVGTLGKLEHIAGEVFVTLDEQRRAIVKLSAGVSADHYDRLVVRIVNKLSGEIDTKTFGFRDGLRGVKRVDERVGAPHPWPGNDPVLNADTSVGAPFYAWAGSMGSFDWYIAVPETTLPLMESVAAYIAQFV